MVELDRLQMTTKYGAEKMQFACWLPKGDTHTCIMCNTYCFPWQQWLCECISVLCFYECCLSC